MKYFLYIYFFTFLRYSSPWYDLLSQGNISFYNFLLFLYIFHLGMISSLKDNPDAVPHVVVLHHVHNPRYVGYLQQQHAF